GPLTGFWVAGSSPVGAPRPTRSATDTCVVYHLQPGKPRLLAFHQPSRRLLGTLRLKGDEKQAVVKLGPAGTVKGRLVDEDGRPLGGGTVRLYPRDPPAAEIAAQLQPGKLPQTGADGKFAIEQVVPGAAFWLHYSRGMSDSGRKRDPELLSVQSVKTLD